MRSAVYPGSFDPITNGHLEIIRRGLNLFDEVIVAVALNVRKSSALFTIEERIEHINGLFENEPVTVKTFDTLLVDFAAAEGACAILRGIRGPEDVAYEVQMVHMNRQLQPNVETVLIPAPTHTQFISSSLVKEVAKFGGDISPFVPEHIAAEVSARLNSSD